MTTWVENHPWYMWLIASLICIGFAILQFNPIYSNTNEFLLWLPIIPGTLLIAPVIQIITEKMKGEKHGNGN